MGSLLSTHAPVQADFLNLSQQNVCNIEALVNGGNLLNRRQCMDLSSKLSKIFQNIQELVVQTNIDLFRPCLENLYRILQKAKLLVSKCCKEDWITESIFQIGNEKDFHVVLLEVGLCYHAIYEQAKCKSELSSSSFLHEDLCQSSIFGHASMSDVQKDQEDLKKRLEFYVNMNQQPGNLLKDKLDHELKLDLARYLLMIWEHSNSDQSPHNTYDLDISSAILWMKENESKWIWGNDNQFLGCGATGGVIGSKWMGTACAKKIFNEGVGESLFLKEAGILFHLNHPQIVNFFCCGNEEGSGKCFIAMERMEMSLAELIAHQKKSKGVPFSFLTTFDIIVQIARGMHYLHDMGVAHRDLKPHNVVVNKLSTDFDQFCVKLVDFGMSKTKVEVSKSNPMTAFGIGTTRYRAPELHEKAHSNGGSKKTKWFKADVYSFAITCAHILSLEMPFEDMTLSTLHDEIMKGLRPRIPPTCPKELVALLNDCWNTNSGLRPNFKEICAKLEEVKHDLLRGLSPPNHTLQEESSISPTRYEFIRMQVEENVALHRQHIAITDDKRKVEEDSIIEGEQIVSTDEDEMVAENFIIQRQQVALNTNNEVQEVELKPTLDTFNSIDMENTDELRACEHVDAMMLDSSTSTNSSTASEDDSLLALINEELSNTVPQIEREPTVVNHSRQHFLVDNEQPIELEVPICCNDCVKKVRNKLQYLKGVKNVVPDQLHQKVRVYGTADPTAVLKQVRLAKKSDSWAMRVDYSEQYRSTLLAQAGR